MRAMVKALTLVAVLTGAVPHAGAAAETNDFYKGKIIRIIVRATPGSDYDSFSRLLARYMPQHIAGTPSTIVETMPGAGGMQAANYLAQIAPRDGTILSIVGQGLPANQALGQAEGMRADLREFNWIGNISSLNQLVIVWHTVPVQSIEDFKTRETIMGSIGGGSISVQISAALKNLLGMKLDIVTGYPGLSEQFLALERGEIEAMSSTTESSVHSTHPQWLQDGDVRVLAQTGVVRSKHFADAPLIQELTTDEKARAALEYISKEVAVGRPLATTPGVPAERVEILRQAFNETMRDKDFLAEAARQNLVIEPTDAAALKGLVDDLIGSPKDLLNLVNKATQLPQN
jgi:tripartite-type tricarboxylate transporter receptor subunit TctC